MVCSWFGTVTTADLAAKVEWAKRHDDELHHIAANGRQFALHHLSVEGVMCYWREIIRHLAEHLLSEKKRKGSSLLGAERFSVSYNIQIGQDLTLTREQRTADVKFLSNLKKVQI